MSLLILKKSKIALSVGLLAFTSGIILELVIRTMAGSIIELRDLGPTLLSIGLVSYGLVILAITMVYTRFNQSKKH